MVENWSESCKKYQNGKNCLWSCTPSTITADGTFDQTAGGQNQSTILNFCTWNEIKASNENIGSQEYQNLIDAIFSKCNSQQIVKSKFEETYLLSIQK